MLKILKGQEDAIKGLIVCEETGNASSLPLVLHFLSAASTSNQKVAIVTSKFTETNYKLICSKAGIRWNSTQINFIECLPPFGSFDISGRQLMENVYEKISGSDPSVVLFDDVSIFESFGANSVEIAVFVHRIYTLLMKSSPDSVLLAPFSIPSTATSLLSSRCRVFAQMTPVGHGFGKDASSKITLAIKSPASPTTKKEY
uniref:Elongator complex protein 6 n=1 Tax=Caenorhabditis tropicalis TaxID=1561998 RepID=A0A1I7T7Z0_9PELO